MFAIARKFSDLHFVGAFVDITITQVPRSASPLGILFVALLALLTTGTSQSFASTCLPIRAGYDLTGEKIRFHYREFWSRSKEKDFDRIMESADKSSFAVLQHPFYAGQCSGLISNFGRDQRNVYYQGRVIEGADPETFEFLHRSYARDRFGVYGPSRRITERIEQFRVISGSYATDGSRYFYEDEVIDEPGFELFPGGYGYARTNTRVFRNGKVLEGVDAPTFELFIPGNSITRDRYRVYYLDSSIPGADAGTFEPISPFYLFRDRRAVYLEGNEIKGADPNTTHASKFHTYTLDKQHVFRGTKMLKRDAATFEELQPPWSKDKFGVYHDDNPIPEADLTSFQALSIGSAKDKNYQYQSGQIVCKFTSDKPGSIPLCSPL